MSVNNTTDLSLQTYPGDSYIVIPPQTVELVRSICYFGVIPFMIASGLVLNVFCLHLFCTLKNKTSTVMFLIALTVADILCLLSGVVVVLNTASKAYGIPFDENQRQQAVPVFSAFLQGLPFRIENGLVFAISLERLYSVLRPIKVRQHSTKKNACVIVAVISLFAIFASIPNLFLFETNKLYSNSTGRYTIVLKLTPYGKNLKLNNAVYVACEALFRYVPIVGVAISSGVTVAVVIGAAKRRLNTGNIQAHHAFIKEKQITKTLLIVTFVFFICQLPSAVVYMIIIIDPEMTPANHKNNVYDMLVPPTFSLIILNSVVNFFIYYAASSTYRTHLRKILSNAFTRKADDTSGPTSLTNLSVISK